MSQRIFDSDLTVQYLQPAELAFPLQARIQTEYLPYAKKQELATQLEANPSGYVLLVAYDDSTRPVQVRVATPPDAPHVWIPWALVSPDLAIHVN